MSLLSTISAGTNGLAAGSSALGLISSTTALLGMSKKNVKGINNFLFSIPKGEELTLSATITDHYVETNYAAQDHIAIDPIRIRLTGEIGELVYSQSEIESYINEVLDRLGPLGVLSPAGAATTKEYLSQYNRLKGALSSAVNRYNQTKASIFGGEYLNKQQLAYGELMKFFSARSTVQTIDTNGKTESQLLTVETPWVTLDNMAIENVVFSQDETTKDFTTIEVTLKQIRFISILAGTGTLSGRAMSGGPIQEMGVAKGEPDNSAAFKGASALFGK
jgi:hypothetical protein